MIKVDNLRKVFGTKAAVDGISFGVEKGEILGFLGPNGAGKSTTMRMITGFFPPTEGKIRVGDFDIEERAVEAKRLIGYLPENAPSYSDMTVRGFLKFCGEVRGLGGKRLREAVDKAIVTCFLEPVALQSVDTLSKGYRHRTCLAQAILHDPPVLVLDEPTDGLDPNQKHEVRSLIRRMGEGKAIIFSTHILEEVEAVCSRAIIIDRGKIVANGTPEELKERAPGAGAVVLNLAGPDATVACEVLKIVEGVGEVGLTGLGRIRVMPKKGANAKEVAERVHGRAVKENWKLEQIRIEEGRLDDVFRAITLPDSMPRRDV